MFSRSDKKRDAGLSSPDDVERFDDIPYGPDEIWQRLDVYRPKYPLGTVYTDTETMRAASAASEKPGMTEKLTVTKKLATTESLPVTEKLPVIVSVHGGGWVYGDKELYQYYCMDLACRGFAVVNFTYHLAPQFRFPQPLLDTCLVFRWLADHADQYGLDVDRLFAVGDSAGAQLLSLYCSLCINPDYAASFDFSAPENCLPKAVALNCGAYNIIPKSGLSGRLLKDYLPGKDLPAEVDLVNPLRHINANFPPTYIMTAVRDFLRKDSFLLRDQLNALGVPNTFRVYDNDTHSLGHVFHLDIRSINAKECNDEECRFFQSFFNNKL